MQWPIPSTGVKVDWAHCKGLNCKDYCSGLSAPAPVEGKWEGMARGVSKCISAAPL